MMFHVEQPPPPTCSTALDNARAARWRQCQSEVTNLNAPCASMSAKAKNVKSFLRVWAKFFTIKQVFCASASAKAKCKTGPAPFYAQCNALSSVICTFAQIKFNWGRSWRGVNNMI